MFKPKPIAIAASIGFVLSFVVGLCSKVSFGFVLLRAFLFAILSGGICYLAMFVIQKFLKSSDSASEAPAVESSETDSETTAAEDTLPDEDSAPEFYVSQSDVKKHTRGTKSVENISVRSESVGSETETSQSRAELKNAEVRKEELPKSNNAFKPISLGSEKTEKLAADDSAISASSQDVADVKNSSASDSATEEVPKKTSSLDEELDELPDFGSVVSDVLDSDGDESSEETSSSYSSSSSSYSDSGAVTQDTETIAQAIKTMLSRD